MLYVDNKLDEVSYTSSIIIEKIGIRIPSDAIPKLISKNIPVALLSEKKGSNNGTFALRYRP